MDILIGVLEQGMIYAIMALGVYITYKILDFPDLTVDGSFSLGAAITVFLITSGESTLISIITMNQNPYIICIYALISGGLAGFITGIIHVKFKVRNLLSGIITMTALYSINLRIAGRANVPIFNMDTIFSNEILDNIFPEALQRYKVLIIISVITIAAKILMDLYFNTKSGYLLRAVGNNSILVTSLAKDSGNVKILGLVIANASVALSGSIMMQQQGFFEISMGTGAMVIGLASVIIGTNLLRKLSFVKSTTGVIIGSIIYKASISMAMNVSFASASDMKLITSLIFLIILLTGNDRKRKVKIVARVEEYKQGI